MLSELCQTEVVQSTKGGLAWRQDGKATRADEGGWPTAQPTAAQGHPPCWGSSSTDPSTASHLRPHFALWCSAQPSIPQEWNTAEATMAVGNLSDPDVGIFISPFGFFCDVRNTDNFGLYGLRPSPNDKVMGSSDCRTFLRQTSLLN